MSRKLYMMLAGSLAMGSVVTACDDTPDEPADVCDQFDLSDMDAIDLCPLGGLSGLSAAQRACFSSDQLQLIDSDNDGITDSDELADNTDACDASDPGAGPIQEPQWSYLSNLAIPEAGSCCADLNGDGEFNNGLGELLPLVGQLAGDFDIEEVLTGLFEEGTLTLLFRTAGLPEDLRRRVNNATVDVFIGDLDPEAETTLAERRAGDGSYIIENDAVVTITGVQNANSILSFQTDSFDLDIDLSSFGLDELGIDLDAITLSIQPALLKLQIENRAGKSGLFTTSATSFAGQPTNYLTGGIGLVAIINDVLNPLTTGCFEDAALAESGALSADVSGGAVNIACNPGAEDAANWSGDGICDLLADETVLGLVCGSLGTLLGGLLDVDTDGDGVDDGLSVGLHLGFSGAAAVTIVE